MLFHLYFSSHFLLYRRPPLDIVDPLGYQLIVLLLRFGHFVGLAFHLLHLLDHRVRHGFGLYAIRVTGRRWMEDGQYLV